MTLTTPVEITIKIDNDSDTTNPLEWNEDGWKLYTFGNGKLITDVRNSDEYIARIQDGTPVAANGGIASKLRAGTAHWVSYFEHGSSVYSVRGTGPQCRWDNVAVAGILVWQGKPKDLAATVEDRTTSARDTLSEYTAWANGECYWYSVECEETGFEDSCGGYIGAEYFMQNVREQLGACMAEYELKPEDVDVTCEDGGRDMWDGDFSEVPYAKV